MGLKSGSRDAGLDESETEGGEEEDDQPENGPVASTDGETETAQTEAAAEGTERSIDREATNRRPTANSIPYKLRRDKVNEGRDQVPYFLREEIIEAEDELRDSLEAMLGEDVYKSDYREAAMVVAQRNPELVAEILREWGYDLDAA